jgi:hypothetical protein
MAIISRAQDPLHDNVQLKERRLEQFMATVSLPEVLNAVLLNDCSGLSNAIERWCQLSTEVAS